MVLVGQKVSELVSWDFSDFIIKHETFMNLKDDDEYDPNKHANVFKKVFDDKHF